MLAHLTGWHALIIIGVIVLLFGAARLPGLARSVGQSARILRAESRGDPSTTDARLDDAPPGRPAAGVQDARAADAPAPTPAPARTVALPPG